MSVRVGAVQLDEYEALIRNDERERVFSLVRSDLAKWLSVYIGDDLESRTVRLCAEQVSWLLKHIGAKNVENHSVAGEQGSMPLLSVSPAGALARPPLSAPDERQLRIVVTGGRHYPDRAKVYRVLSVLRPTRIAEGGAEGGADLFAREWAIHNGVETQSYPVTDWRDENGAIDYSAGPRRNGRMLRAELPLLDAVVGFPGNRGTANCKMQGAKLGVPVLEVL